MPSGFKSLLLLGLLMLLLTVAGEVYSTALRYDQQLILSGQYWRLISGHFVHLGWGHLMLNLSGFLLIQLLFQDTLGDKVLLLYTLILSTGISLLFLSFNPELIHYVGFSGVLHGLLAIGAIQNLQYNKSRNILLLVLIAAKLGWEQIAGALPGSASMAGGNVIVDAHLYGAICGTLLALALLCHKKNNQQPKNQAETSLKKHP